MATVLGSALVRVGGSVAGAGTIPTAPHTVNGNVTVNAGGSIVDAGTGTPIGGGTGYGEGLYGGGTYGGSGSTAPGVLVDAGFILISTNGALIDGTVLVDLGFEAPADVAAIINGAVLADLGGTTVATHFATFGGNVVTDLGFTATVSTGTLWQIDIENPTGPAVPVFPTLAFQISSAPPLSANPVWVNVPSRVMGWTSHKGRGSELEDFPAGTGTITLGNEQGLFDPDNQASPLATLLTTNRRVRITANYQTTTVTALDMFVDVWPMDDDPTFDARAVTVPVVDAFTMLANRVIRPGRPFTFDDPNLGQLDANNRLSGDPYFPATLSGLLIDSILDVLAWPETMRDIDTGLSPLTEIRPTDKALPVMQQAARSEMGALYVTGDSVVTYKSRGNRSYAIAGTFSDNPAFAGLPYEDIAIDPASKASIKNTVTRSTQVPDGDPISFTAIDFTSEGKYGPLEDSKTDLLNSEYREIVDQCAYVLSRFSDGVVRITGLTVSAVEDPAASFPIMLTADVGTLIKVGRTPRIGGPVVIRDCTIESVSHEVIAPATWRTTWGLIEADVTPYFKLDDLLLGKLDFNNVFSY